MAVVFRSAFRVILAMAARIKDGGAMAGYFIVHSGRCAKDIMCLLKEFLSGKHSLWDLFRNGISCISDRWHEYREPPLTGHRKDAMRLVNDGVKLYNAKKYEEAVKVFKEATECDASYARAYVYLGNTLYKRFEHGEALNAWERAISVDPLSKAAGKARAKVDHVKSQNQMAIRDLHEGLKK
ncbi:MAG: tetratricopeptide repeat protein [Candidatus Hydrogenedentes bacterium]|nr:tetratricopeptide repeat protein [Candidatus Hydrogenedentota bacterium]